MKLNAPTKLVFLIAIALLVIGLLCWIGLFGKYSTTPMYLAYWLTFASTLVLGAGCVLKGF
jgi:hypothetical protein